jgi:hypothetical protein
VDFCSVCLFVCLLIYFGLFVLLHDKGGDDDERHRQMLSDDMRRETERREWERELELQRMDGKRVTQHQIRTNSIQTELMTVNNYIFFISFFSWFGRGEASNATPTTR